MYGGPAKLGRGGSAVGGRGGGKRGIHSSFPPPPPHRPSVPASRLSVGGAGGAGPRNRATNSGATTPAHLPASEETFSLVTGNPLAFAMIIRLAPDLVDEIKRVEAQGGTARIKFDSNANNPSGNVIDAGGKDFRFTWSRELGDLCDIYEERQSGEEGNGLLVESGGAWRKLNVQRILDESTKNHVKMRSEEAERKQKSRKAIVLEHGNPSMKSQMKALAAAETNPWRMQFKQKKEPAFKKRKVEPPQATKAVYKPGLSSTTTTKSKPTPSPLPSPPEQTGALTSPFGGGGNLAKSHVIVEDIMPIPATSKENTASSEKEIPGRAISASVRETPGHKGNLGATPMDLQSMLITLLLDNPKGMSLKALEKTIGDTIPNAGKKIEPIIRKIATFQAPGRYFLKPGVELESLKKPSSENGSSPEDDRQQTPAPEDNQDQAAASEPRFAEKAPRIEQVDQAQLNSKLGGESSLVEKIDTQPHSPDLSKSRSPVGSRSGSSSDSESDASSHSKHGSDIEVDIMTSDDEKVPSHKLQASESLFPTSSILWRTPDDRPGQNGIDVKAAGHGSNAVEFEKDLPDGDQEIEMVNFVPKKEDRKPAEESKPISSDGDDHQERQVYTGNLFNERESMFKDGFKREQSDSSEGISKGKSRKGSDAKRFDDKSDRMKRSKTGNMSQPPTSAVRNTHFSDIPQNESPDGLIEAHYRAASAVQMTNRADRDGNADFGLQKGYAPIPGKFIPDSQQSGRRPIDRSARAKVPDTAERPSKYAESLEHGLKYSESSFQANEGFSTLKDKVYRETQDEDGYANEKKMPRNIKDGGFGDKYSFDSRERKHELVGKFKEAGQVSNSYMGSSPRDNSRIVVDRSPMVNGRGILLQRELSDLELGKHVGKATLDSGKLKYRHSEAGADQGIGPEDYGEAHKRMPVSAALQQDTKRGLASHATKESKTQKSNMVPDLSDKQKDAFLTDSSNNGRKRRESSSDENSCSYSKYEKEEPELKGPIKDFSQYKEYVQEYHEKYDSYNSLNKILESYRNEFHKLGKDLEVAKGRDLERYYNILEQLKDTYSQCSTRHKRLKKIFVVLHEELKNLKQRIKDYALPYTRD
ncbi:unnamed protein product, partial [Vitis vinifera]